MKKFDPREIVARVKQTVEEEGLFDGARRVLVAFSAGPDSVCLVDILHALYGRRLTLALGYVNHGLRPAGDLQREEAIVARYAKKYGIRHRIVRVRVLKRGAGPESAARDARYRALAALARRLPATHIALAHNLDDAVETLIMNLVRGSGPAGLESIPVRRPPFVRPLINVRRRDIRDYVRHRRLEHAVDATNRDPAFRRNLIRRRLIPLLERLNPRIRETIQRTSALIRDESAIIDRQAARAAGRVISATGDTVALDIKTLMRYNKAIARRVIRKALRFFCADLAGLTSKHVEMIHALGAREPGRKVNLPKRLSAEKCGGKICLARRPRVRKWRHEVPIGLRGTWQVGEKIFLKTFTVNGRINFQHLPGARREVFDLDQIAPPLTARRWQAGDAICIRAGRKKLQKVFQEKKIPAAARGDVPLLCDQRGVLWLVGIRRAYRGMVSGQTRRLLVAEYRGKD